MLDNQESAKPLLTILTPTYNRCHLLPRLYHSIISQRVPDGTFEWLVIDDGSTDGTNAYLDGLSARHPGLVRFTRQPNGGKHRALNAGAKLARGEWVMVVDSDDWLNEEALTKTFAAIQRFGADGRVATIVTPLQFPSLRQQHRFLLTDQVCTITKWHAVRVQFETCMISRLDALRSAPFPEVPDEKFMAESWQNFRLSKIHLSCLVNEYLICAEYQADGLSANSRANRVAAPISAVLVYGEMLSAPLSWNKKLRCAINRGRFYWHSFGNGKDPSKHGENAILFELMVGLPLYFIDIFAARMR